MPRPPTPLPPTRPGAHDPALDGLRALAVMGVIAFHAWPGLLPGGWVGVELFFVLSGFLITRLAVREADATGGIDLLRFARRRALRIVPAFVLMLAGTGLLAALLGPGAVAGPGAALCAAGFAMNWCRAFGWTADGALGHAWSLAVEEQFYLLWPPLLLLAGRRGRLPLAAGLAAAAAGWRCWLVLHGAGMDRTYNGLDTHADALLIGAVLAFVDRGAPGRAGAAASALAIGLAAAFALLVDARLPWVQAAGLSLAALGSAALVGAARREGWLRDALARRPLVAVGRRSYGLYLWHYPLLFAGRPHLPLALGTALPVAAAALLACASWRFVERPALAMRMRVRVRTPEGAALAT